MTDGTREVKLYHAPNLHSPGMLVGYVPDARVFFPTDIVTDTFPLNPTLASSVHELIQEKWAFGRDDRMSARQRHALCSACQCAREVSGHEHETAGRLIAVVVERLRDYAVWPKPSITILLPTSSLDQVYMKAVWYEKEEISQPGPARRRDAGRTGRTRSSPS